MITFSYFPFGLRSGGNGPPIHEQSIIAKPQEATIFTQNSIFVLCSRKSKFYFFGCFFTGTGVNSERARAI